MTRNRLILILLVMLVVGGGYYAVSDRDSERGAGVGVARGARVAAQVALHTREAVPVEVVMPAMPPLAGSVLTEAERKMATAGLRPEQVAAMKEAFPDWKSRFASASDDFIKADAARVKDLVRTTIPGEVAHGLGANAPHLVDDLARTGGSVVDDVARNAGRFGDDLLRLVGLGAAGAAAAGAAALKNRKKE